MMKGPGFLPGLFSCAEATAISRQGRCTSFPTR